MGRAYAELRDVIALGYTLSEQQAGAVEALLSAASAKLRVIARKYGKNLDEMCADEDFGEAVKSAVVQSAMRALSGITDTSPAVSQVSQSALGYSATMTYLNAGQSVYFMRNELKDLGILRQSYGALEVFGNDRSD